MRLLTVILITTCLSISIGNENILKPIRKLHNFLTKQELKQMFDVEKYEEDYDVVFIRMRRETGGKRKERHLTNNRIFKLKGENVDLELEVNRRLTSPSLRIIKTSSQGDENIEIPKNECHYLAYDNNSVAAVSNCANGDLGEMHGLLLLPNGVVILQPVPRRVRKALNHLLNQGNESESENIAHIIRQHPEHKEMKRRVSELWNDEVIIDELKMKEDASSESTNNSTNRLERKANGEMNLELGVFFDEAAYKKFMPLVKNDNKNLRDMILGFVNQLQALYYQPSLERKLHITLVHLEIQTQQPSDLPHHDGERDELLTTFCKYQAKKNPDADSDPHHWDMALYISGLNFYGMDNGEKSGITMGLAPVGGVCIKNHACVIAEFGAVNDLGKPYPSAGLMSTYVAAHEMGHNLGMHHDGPPSNAGCPSNGFVMSPSRGTKGETVWSSCSAKIMKTMDKECLYDKPPSMDNAKDHSKFELIPGQIWDAFDQCRVFLRDEEATIYNETVLETVCEQTLCKTPNRFGYYSAGPALDGTFCGKNRWCQHGKCVSWGNRKMKSIPGGWSNWNEGQCKSGCIKDSKGAKKDLRKCDNPKPKNTEKICEGEPYRIKLCDDSAICSQRIDVQKFASKRCHHFSKHAPEVTSEGVQVPHQDGERSWQSCAIYCKTKSGSWYTPRYELNDLDIDTFFPDGTLCHKEGKKRYYCQGKVCSPASTGRNVHGKFHEAEISIDVLNNAKPRGEPKSERKFLKDYFEYRQNGKQSSKPKSQDFSNPKEDDYVIDTISF